MANTITAKDVALNAEVSVATVSRVFNNHTNVNPEIRKRVLKAASELGYFGTPTQNGQKPPLAKTIKECGFLIYDANLEDRMAIGGDFWLRLLHGVENEASKQNIKVVYRAIGSLLNEPQLLINMIYELKLNGVLLVGPVPGEVVKSLQVMKLPIILVDNYIPELPIDAVLCNNFEGARLAVKNFVENGHRQIAFLGGPTDTRPWPSSAIYSIEQRLAGYQVALLEAGLSLDHDLIIAGNLLREGGYTACKQLLDTGKPFTAIFCANDFSAVGVLRGLREAGLRVPQDVSLIGFDDMEVATDVEPALSTIRFPKENLGAAALRRLIARAADPEGLSEQIVLEVSLIKRASVGPAQK